MAYDTHNRQKIQECLTASKRWKAFQSYRQWYYYMFLGRGKTHDEAVDASWDWAMKLYPDWEERNSFKAQIPDQAKPKLKEIREEAAKAGVIHGAVNTKNIKMYHAARKRLKLPDMPPRNVPEPNKVESPKPPKLPHPVDKKENKLLPRDIFADKPPCNTLDEVNWVQQHIDVEATTRDKAPSAGAWTLLLWARENTDDFIKQIYIKTMPSKNQLDREYANRDKGEVQLEFIDRLREVASELKLDVV